MSDKHSHEYVGRHRKPDGAPASDKTEKWSDNFKLFTHGTGPLHLKKKEK